MIYLFRYCEAKPISRLIKLVQKLFKQYLFVEGYEDLMQILIIIQYK